MEKKKTVRKIPTTKLKKAKPFFDDGKLYLEVLYNTEKFRIVGFIAGWKKERKQFDVVGVDITAAWKKLEQWLKTKN